MWLEGANYDATVLQCNCVTASLGGQAGHDKNTNTYIQQTDRDPAVTGDKAWYRSTGIPAFQSLSPGQCQEHTRRQQQKSLHNDWLTGRGCQAGMAGLAG